MFKISVLPLNDFSKKTHICLQLNKLLSNIAFKDEIPVFVVHEAKSDVRDALLPQR